MLISALSSMLLRISLLALYLRLFKPIKVVTTVIYLCSGITIIFYLVTMIAELVVGIPRQDEGWIVAQRRYGPWGLKISVARGIFGVLSDFVILFIPLTQIVKLYLPLRKKIVLICVFLTGLLYVQLWILFKHLKILFTGFFILLSNIIEFWKYHFGC